MAARCAPQQFPTGISHPNHFDEPVHLTPMPTVEPPCNVLAFQAAIATGAMTTPAEPSCDPLPLKTADAAPTPQISPFGPRVPESPEAAYLGPMAHFSRGAAPLEAAASCGGPSPEESAIAALQSMSTNATPTDASVTPTPTATPSPPQSLGPAEAETAAPHSGTTAATHPAPAPPAAAAPQPVDIAPIAAAGGAALPPAMAIPMDPVDAALSAAAAAAPESPAITSLGDAGAVVPEPTAAAPTDAADTAVPPSAGATSTSTSDAAAAAGAEAVAGDVPPFFRTQLTISSGCTPSRRGGQSLPVPSAFVDEHMTPDPVQQRTPVVLVGEDNEVPACPSACPPTPPSVCLSADHPCENSAPVRATRGAVSAIFGAHQIWRFHCSLPDCLQRSGACGGILGTLIPVLPLFASWTSPAAGSGCHPAGPLKTRGHMAAADVGAAGAPTVAFFAAATSAGLVWLLRPKGSAVPIGGQGAGSRSKGPAFILSHAAMPHGLGMSLLVSLPASSRVHVNNALVRATGGLLSIVSQAFTSRSRRKGRGCLLQRLMMHNSTRILPIGLRCSGTASHPLCLPLPQRKAPMTCH